MATASRHGATREVGDAVAAVLSEHGHEIVRREVSDVLSDGVPDGIDVAVLGSGTYAAQWLPAASTLRSRLLKCSAPPPIWQFSCGIRDVSPSPLDSRFLEPVTPAQPRRAPVVFGGRIRLAGLTLAERSVVAVVRAQEGDYRIWEDVRGWAGLLASRLASESTVDTSV